MKLVIKNAKSTNGARLSCFFPDMQILAVFQQKHYFAVAHANHFVRKIVIVS